ncbi:MAG: fuconate dehydratase, partial [Ruegeria sp.]
YVQHMSMIDYVAISREKDSKRIEFVDHLHEHFEDPCIVKNGAYQAPTRAGFSIEMKPASIAEYTFNGGVSRKGAA